MTTFTANPRQDGPTAYSRANALARLTPAAALGLVNVLTIDPVTPLVTLAVVLAWLPWSGLSTRQALRISRPLLLAAATLAVVNTLASSSPGLGVEDVRAGLVTAARLLAIALPGVLAFATIDPVDLVDALVQQLHLSVRFGYGALAALRLVPLLADDWRMQAVTARARGVAPAGIRQHVGLLARRLLTLLVSAVRRASRMAVALDARGFDEARRATSRPSRWGVTDTMWSAAGLVIGFAVAALSVALGSWNPLFTG